MVKNKAYSLQIQSNWFPHFGYNSSDYTNFKKRDLYKNCYVNINLLSECVHKQAHTHIGQRAVLLKPEGEEMTFPIFLLFLSCSPVSPLSLSWLLPHSLCALSNSVIIKAKEYLWVSTHSISLSTLRPAIILCTHAHTDMHSTHTHRHTYKHVCVRAWTHTHDYIKLRLNYFFDW